MAPPRGVASRPGSAATLRYLFLGVPVPAAHQLSSRLLPSAGIGFKFEAQ